MFSFLKKSRAFKFLCSACLICSLGSFVNVYGEDSATGAQITELYVQGRLGYAPERIFLADPHLSQDGILTGTLMYATDVDENGKPDESKAESLWNNLEDSELTLFLKNASGKYIAVSGKVTFDGNSDDKKYEISIQLYKLTDPNNPAQVTDISSATPLTSLLPGRYAITGVVSDKGNTTLFGGPVL